MESMFLWIIMFAGAAVVLLGVFLVASERELKKKRGEINQLLDRLEAAPKPAVASATIDSAEANGLRTKTQELLKEIASLQDDLDAAHRAINELRAGKPDGANETSLAQVEQLRYANSQLDAQVEELRRQLQAGEARWASAADTESQQRQSQLEHSLIDLKQQLERSQARVRELETAQAPTVNEAQQREETDKLEARIAQLQASLNAAAESACQADILRQRLSESERTAQELRETLRQRDEELPRWRAQLAASEEFKKRLMALHPVYDQLVAKQNSLIDQQRAYHGELKSFAEFLSASHDGTMPPTSYTYFDPEGEPDEKPIQLMLTPLAAADGQAALAAPAAPAAPVSASPVQANGDSAASTAEPKAGFGLFHTLIALLVGGALVALFWSQSGTNPSADAAKPLPQSAPAPKPAPQTANPPSEVASAAAPAKPVIEAPAPAQESPKKIPAAAALAGIYQVTQATRVFAAPAEYAQQVGEIEPGLKVTVVNGRDGWLEIHSKNGRPPGFIRSHTAARIDG